MRLGFWNRLALVTFVIGVPIASFTAIVDKQAELDANRTLFLDTCEKLALAKKNPSQTYADFGTCREKAYSFGTKGPYDITGEHWKMYLQAFALAGLAIYILIAAIVAVAKWVWRGRTP